MESNFQYSWFSSHIRCVKQTSWSKMGKEVRGDRFISEKPKSNKITKSVENVNNVNDI